MIFVMKSYVARANLVYLRTYVKISNDVGRRKRPHQQRVRHTPLLFIAHSEDQSLYVMQFKTEDFVLVSNDDGGESQLQS
jgi:hypothetical protein